MKKIYLSLLFAVVTMFATAQNYQLKVLDFEGTKWSALIDSPQYGGPLLYGEGYGFYTEDEAYSWYDEGNTFLKSTINNAYGSWCYWSGGVAVSNYYNEVEEGTYQNQLSVNYNKDGNHGHNNSANFAACFGYNDGNAYSTDSRPLISFGDGVARVIDHLYVINTAYTLNCVLNGSGFNVPATADTYIERTTYELSGKGGAIGKGSTGGKGTPTGKSNLPDGAVPAKGRKYRVRVATSDRLEQMIILGNDAMRVSAREFKKEVEQVNEEISAFLKQLARRNEIENPNKLKIE